MGVWLASEDHSCENTTVCVLTPSACSLWRFSALLPWLWHTQITKVRILQKSWVHISPKPMLLCFLLLDFDLWKNYNGVNAPSTFCVAVYINALRHSDWLHPLILGIRISSFVCLYLRKKFLWSRWSVGSFGTWREGCCFWYRETFQDFLICLFPDEKVFPRSIKTQGLKIHQRFHFASALKRMSVLASYEKIGSTDLCYIAAVKGAPETLHKMVSAAL